MKLQVASRFGHVGCAVRPVKKRTEDSESVMRLMCVCGKVGALTVCLEIPEWSLLDARV